MHSISKESESSGVSEHWKNNKNNASMYSIGSDSKILTTESPKPLDLWCKTKWEFQEILYPTDIQDKTTLYICRLPQTKQRAIPNE